MRAVARAEQQLASFVSEGDHAALLVGVGDGERVGGQGAARPTGVDEAEKPPGAPDVVAKGRTVLVALDERALQRVGVVVLIKMILLE